MKLLFSIVLLFCMVCANSVLGQDVIVKNTGDSIQAKVMEIGIETISYKRWNMTDGPTYVIKKSEVTMIRFSNGTVEKFNDAPATSTQTINVEPAEEAKPNSSGSPDVRNRIELSDGKFSINGRGAKRKEVNSYLARSRDPAITLGLKGAKGMALAQSITKITAYPTTIIGGITSIFYLAEGYQLVQRGRATRKTFWSMGLSVVSTISLPITSKILKKQSDKMYRKLIDLYNVTN
jgi:hypothetical protein